MTATMKRAPGGWNLNDPEERLKAMSNARATPMPRRPTAAYTGNIDQDRLAVGVEYGIDASTWQSIANGVRWPEIVRLRREVSNRLIAFGYKMTDVARICGMAYTTIVHHKCGTNPASPTFTPSEGFRRACDAVGVEDSSLEAILGPCRAKETVALRAELAYRLRAMGFSWPSVARAFKRRSHAGFLIGARRYADGAGLPRL